MNVGLLNIIETERSLSEIIAHILSFSVSTIINNTNNCCVCYNTWQFTPPEYKSAYLYIYTFVRCARSFQPHIMQIQRSALAACKRHT